MVSSILFSPLPIFYHYTLLFLLCQYLSHFYISSNLTYKLYLLYLIFLLYTISTKKDRPLWLKIVYNCDINNIILYIRGDRL